MGSQRFLPQRSVRVKSSNRSTLTDSGVAEKHEKVRKERYNERRGRPLERKHLTHKEKKEKVEGWQKGLET